MAADANEQVKEILRQLIKHRFWIAIGFASLFAVTAYFMGSGPVQAEAKKEIEKINGAAKGVQAYSSTAKPTGDYKPIVEEKTVLVGKDVNRAWKELYDRQKDLLNWPDVAKENIAKWGREYPKDVDNGRVQIAIVDYIQAYPSYVDMVYKTFNPFDYETGKGVVAAPPKEALLRPAPFAVENTKLPTLGKIWAAQERLWVQRTMLDVIHKVNKQAKDWDSAILKEIKVLEVGNSEAQDQRSLAKGDTLTEAPDILSPEQEAAAAAKSSDSGGGGAGASGQMSGRMAMMGGMGGMMGGGAATKADDNIYYITPADDKGQYKILPVMMTVLIDQDRVQDLLVEMANSPMSIQVKDLELERPSSQVKKPEKGEANAGYGMMMGGGMMGMMRRGYGGMASQMNDQMMMRMSGMQSSMRGMMGSRGMMGGMMGGGATSERKGVDVRNVDREAERKKKEEELEKRKGPSFVDPYFNIVQVTVYGQARFYNRPPAEAEGETPQSPGEAAAAEAPKAEAPAEKKAETPAEKAADAPADKKAAAPAASDAKTQPAPEAPAAKPTEEKPAAKPAADAKNATPSKDAPSKDASDAAPKK